MLSLLIKKKYIFRLINLKIILLLLIILLSSCAMDKKTPNNESNSSRPVPGQIDNFSLDTLVPVTADSIQIIVGSTNAKVTLVNIWATWCRPCVEEFPSIMAVYRKYKNQGLQLVLVSADFRSREKEAVDFLNTQGVDFTCFIKNQNDQEFINGLDSRWSGALPATFIYDNKGNQLSFWEGEADEARFEEAVRSALNE